MSRLSPGYAPNQHAFRYRKETVLTLAALVCAAVVYGLLHQRYYLAYVDDAWCVSQMHFFFDTGRTEDILFRAVGAPDRVLVFAKTFFYVYGGVLSRLGWTKSNAHLLSTAFIWLSAGTWFFICRRLNVSPTLQKLIPISMLLFPPYFSAGNLARYDAMVFFLSSLTFLSFLSGQYFLTGLILVVSLESHPLGITGAFFILAYLLHHKLEAFGDRRRLFTAVASFAAGAAIAMAYVLWIHADVTLERFLTTLAVNSTMNDPNYGFIVKYFTRTYWYRDVWELPLIGAALFLYIRHRLWQRHGFIAILFVLAIVESFVVSRPNANYMLFAYPAFLLLMFVTFEERRLLGKLVPVMGAALLAVYGFTYAVNRGYDFDRVAKETRATLADERLPVIGMPDNWFAVPERQFYPIYHSVNDIPSLGLKEFYLVRNDYVSDQSNNYHELIATLTSTHNCAPIRSFSAFDDHTVDVFRCMAKSHGFGH